LVRRPGARDQGNPTYPLALARALGTAGRDAEARALLMRLRDAEPDSAEINYRLARVAARSGDAAEAVRYYHLAIYSLAPADPQFDRRHVRLELAGFLLDAGQRRAAAAELDAVSEDLPREAAAYVQVAELFERAGDTARAFDTFAAAVKLDPRDAAALGGASRTAAALHDDDEARRYLRAMMQPGSTRRGGATRP
jgi:Tfp pilus assembly protein PilF